MKNIAKAIIEVMKAVNGMEKKSNVGVGKNSYKGTKDQDVKEVFNEELAKNGLCIMPIDIEEQTETSNWIDEQYKKRKQSVFTKVKVKYLLLHTSGESIELCGYGHGVDSQDKGAGKATTYALKNCLLYTFLTPVGKIDDTDETHSEEIEVPNKEEITKPKKASFPPERYQGAAESIKKGESTFEAIKKHYTLSAAAETTINGMIKNLK